MQNKDKVLHFVIGIAITLVVGHCVNPVAGLASAALVMRLKEVYDKRRPTRHTYDGWDAYWGLCGAIPAQAVLFLVS